MFFELFIFLSEVVSAQPLSIFLSFTVFVYLPSFVFIFRFLVFYNLIVTPLFVCSVICVLPCRFQVFLCCDFIITCCIYDSVIRILPRFLVFICCDFIIYYPDCLSVILVLRIKIPDTVQFGIGLSGYSSYDFSNTSEYAPIGHSDNVHISKKHSYGFAK